MVCAKLHYVYENRPQTEVCSSSYQAQSPLPTPESWAPSPPLHSQGFWNVSAAFQHSTISSEWWTHDFNSQAQPLETPRTPEHPRNYLLPFARQPLPDNITTLIWQAIQCRRSSRSRSRPHQQALAVLLGCRRAKAMAARSAPASHRDKTGIHSPEKRGPNHVESSHSCA
jgi:hypothetical protein